MWYYTLTWYCTLVFHFIPFETLSFGRFFILPRVSAFSDPSDWKLRHGVPFRFSFGSSTPGAFLESFLDISWQFAIDNLYSESASKALHLWRVQIHFHLPGPSNVPDMVDKTWPGRSRCHSQSPDWRSPSEVGKSSSIWWLWVAPFNQLMQHYNVLVQKMDKRWSSM